NARALRLADAAGMRLTTCCTTDGRTRGRAGAGRDRLHAPPGRVLGCAGFACLQHPRNRNYLKSHPMLQQRTLKGITRAVGVGLPRGQKVERPRRPAPPATGVVFRRVDLPQPVDIPVNTAAVSDTRLASTISPNGDPGGPKVQTIEHLMSACAGLGLDNLI